MNEEKVERLYFLGAGNYVQWNGKEPAPQHLVRYRAANADRLPSYMPLPSGTTVFVLNQGMLEVSWPGRGPLPEVVLNYVKKEGVLPATKGLTGRTEIDTESSGG